jgi:hypothetical protein
MLGLGHGPGVGHKGMMPVVLATERLFRAERGPSKVLGGNQAHRQRPFNVQGAVVEANASGGRGAVWHIHLVQHLRIVLQTLEAVSATRRDDQRNIALGFKVEPQPTQIARGAWPQVDDDVVDRATYASDELHLSVRGRAESASRGQSLRER